MTSTTARQRLRFTDEDDLLLLRETLGQNPYEDCSRWAVIQENINSITGKNFTIRCLREHIRLLLELWHKKDNANKKKSGVEEEYTEKDSLLQDIFDLVNETHKPSKRKLSSKEKESVESGKIARNMWAKMRQEKEENIFIHTDHSYISLPSGSTEQFYTVEDIENTSLSEVKSQEEKPVENNMSATVTPKGTQLNRTILGPVRTRQSNSQLRKSALDYLEKKSEMDSRLQDRQMDLEEKKLKLEEEKFALQALERKKTLEFEEERMKVEINKWKQSQKIIESQQNIIDTFLKNIGNNNNVLK